MFVILIKKTLGSGFKYSAFNYCAIADEFFINSEGTHFLNFSVAFCYTNQDGHISLSSQIRYLFAVKTIPKLTLGFLSYQE